MSEMYNGNEDVDANKMEIEDNPGNSGNQEIDLIIDEPQPPQVNIIDDTIPDARVEEDPLATPMKQFEELQQRAEAVEHKDNGDREDSAIGKKLCATRHGCQGATDCNYSYGSYPG